MGEIVIQDGADEVYPVQGEEEDSALDGVVVVVARAVREAPGYGPENGSVQNLDEACQGQEGPPPCRVEEAPCIVTARQFIIDAGVNQVMGESVHSTDRMLT